LKQRRKKKLVEDKNKATNANKKEKEKDENTNEPKNANTKKDQVKKTFQIKIPSTMQVYLLNEKGIRSLISDRNFEILRQKK